MDLRSLMRWPEFTNFAAHSGPTMTLGGTVGKVAFLAVLFLTAGFFSWKYFHERAQQLEDEREQVVAARTADGRYSDAEALKIVDDVVKRTELHRDSEALDWRHSNPIQRDLRYPLFAWLLFFVGLAPFFLSSRNCAAYLAPICVVLEGIAFGSLEALTDERFAGMTLIGLTVTAGLMLSILIGFWTGLLDGTNPFLLGVVGVVGSIAFAYAATAVTSLLGYPVEYLHAGPDTWKMFVLAVLVVEITICLFACEKIRDAVEAGAPKWLEWRAAMRIFVSFIDLVIATRGFFKARHRRGWRFS